jgi:hypothetical protein
MMIGDAMANLRPKFFLMIFFVALFLAACGGSDKKKNINQPCKGSQDPKLGQLRVVWTGGSLRASIPTPPGVKEAELLAVFYVPSEIAPFVSSESDIGPGATWDRAEAITGKTFGRKNSSNYMKRVVRPAGDLVDPGYASSLNMGSWDSTFLLDKAEVWMVYLGDKCGSYVHKKGLSE